MGCFLACFGSSKHAKRRKQRRKVLPFHHWNTSNKPEQASVSSVENDSKTTVTSAHVSELKDQTEKQFNFNKTKNVAFGSNVQTHDEEANFPAEKSEESGENEDISLENSSQSKSSSADSSLGSYTINHRYQNFRDNNGEDEYLGSDQSDEDNEDDVGDKGEEHNDEVEPSFDESKKLNLEMPVDTSLSDWLVSSETTLVKYGTNMPASNSVINHEDRPILGALTLEEIKQFSTSCSQMKSPSQNLDEMPIIGSVGTYWTHQDSSSASSFRGIPNTSSKYKEDMRVNWHETPFETRLEIALNREVL